MNGGRVATLLLAAVVVGFALRAAAIEQYRHANYAAGLTSWQAETARNLDRGIGFTIDERELAEINHAQNTRDRLIDPSALRLTTGPAAQPEVLEMPGLAIVLAGMWELGPESYTAVLWLQAVLDALAIVLVWWIGRKLSGRDSVGLIAASLYATAPELVRLTAAPLLDSWAPFLTVFVVAAFVWARDRQTVGRLIVAGALVGVGVYFRPFMLLLAPLLSLILVRSWRGVLIPLAAALVLLAPWSVRNAVAFDAFIPTRSGIGQALWEGLGQRPNTVGAVNNDGVTLAMVHRSRPELVYGTPAYDSYLLAKALHAIRAHPGAYLDGVLARLAGLLPCLLVLVFPRRFVRAKLVALAVALATIGPYVLVRTEPRFSAPALVAYALLAGCALVALVDAAAPALVKVRSRRAAGQGVRVVE